MRSELSVAVLVLTLLSAACSSAPGARPREPRAAQTDGPAHSSGAHADPHAHAAVGGRPQQADPHGLGLTAVGVPAYVTDPAALDNLPQTLPPETFTGRRRAGYEAVRAIPKTIAQLPCYCHCDRGFGHKSLHSCFVDDHGANCSVCLEEALLAYKLETEQGLKPEEIRERIISQYGSR